MISVAAQDTRDAEELSSEYFASVRAVKLITSSGGETRSSRYNALELPSSRSS